MTDERRDEETGRALGRAIGSQTVRETPYAASRLAQRVDRPTTRGWTYALPVAAALALFVAMGWFLAGRGPQGVATPQTSPPPGLATPGGAVPTPQPTTSGTPFELALVYFVRDGLPPVGAPVQAPAPFRTLPASERISARVRTLWDARPPAPGIGTNSFGPHVGGPSLANVTTTISGDTATVIIDAGRWDSLSSAETIALTQQLVYTITEEPGVRRAAVREPGKDHAVIGNGIWREALTREDVFGYGPLADADRMIESDGAAVPAELTAKIDYVQTGPGQPVRLVVDLAPRQPVAGGTWLPKFTATLRPTPNIASVAKYEIEVFVRGGQEKSLRDQTIDVTPLRYVRVRSAVEGTVYTLGVDDARPWRVSVLPWISGGMRLYVDIGGVPSTVNRNIAVYTPIVDQAVTRTITIGGVARVFEANVSWRLRDANGREVARGFTTATNGTGPVWGSFQTSAQVPADLTGRATLEVYWGSPRDGSDQDVVSIPLTVR